MKGIMQTIKSTRRKVIRYLMFCKKAGNKPESPLVSRSKDKEILNFYENQDDFLGWDKFETHWDIGISDDVVAKANRPEKWFLAEKDKTQIVKRPDDYWEKEARRLNISTHALYELECRKRGIEMMEFFDIFFK